MESLFKCWVHSFFMTEKCMEDLWTDGNVGILQAWRKHYHYETKLEKKHYLRSLWIKNVLSTIDTSSVKRFLHNMKNMSRWSQAKKNLSIRNESLMIALWNPFIFKTRQRSHLKKSTAEITLYRRPQFGIQPQELSWGWDKNIWKVRKWNLCVDYGKLY